MGVDQYFLLAAMPALGELGSSPPIGLAELSEYASESRRVSRLMDALLLADDLMQREAFLAGQLADVTPVVLSEEAARNQAALPEYLVALDETPQVAVESDDTWRAYFHHVAELGRREGNLFLPRWVSFEVGLRNVLAGERARRLGLSEINCAVAAELVVWEEDYSEALRSWAAADTPREGQQELIRFRWNWLHEHARWFSFSEDEMLVYTLRLILLEQWWRIQEGDAGGNQER
jgi:hypothetical protein